MVPLPLIMSLAQFVPNLVDMIAGDKAGKVAEKVVSVANQVTGATNPEEALYQLQQNAELANEFKLAVLDHWGELEKLYLADRQNARQRDVELRKAGYTNKRADFMVGAAFVSLILTIGMIWSGATTYIEIPDAVLAILNTAVGMILKMLSDAFAFEFGSSRGSKEKTMQMLEKN